MNRPLGLENQVLQVNPLIKIRFPSYLTSYKWTIEEKLQKVRFAMPFPAILVMILCIKPTRKSDLLNILLEKVDIDVGLIEKLISSLISNNLILTENNEYLQLVQSRSSLLDRWKKAGWGEAGDYHWFSWDFPFLDYSKGGGKRSLALMGTFQRAEPDVQRVKAYKDRPHKIALSPPSALPPSFKEEDSLGLKNFLRVVSFAFAKRANLPCSWSPVSMIRRTSPSGGARHPTEGYALVLNIVGLKPGWYHIQTDPPSLVFLDKDLDPPEFAFTFPGLQDKKWAAIIVLTSVFERNMYRYREPRTFRSIHMDAGHILGTIEMLGKEESFTTQVMYNFCEKNILKYIEADLLDEGIMACVAISSNQPKNPRL